MDGPTATAESTAGQPHADWALTGIARLVTLAAPYVTAENPLGVVANAAIAARHGRIVWAGPETALAEQRVLDGVPESARHDARGHAVVPGFVDSHTHFLFAGDRAEEFHLRHAGVSYETLAQEGRGILSTVRATRAASAGELAALGRTRLRSFAAYGTTTVEGKTGYGLDLESEARCLDVMAELAAESDLPRVVPTLLGAHTVPPEHRGSPQGRARYVELVCERMLPAFAGRAVFCDVFCEATAFSVEEARRILVRARELGYRLKLHANQLGESGGAALAADLGATSADHLDFASDADLERLRTAGVVATLLPGCSFTLSTPYPNARRFYAHGLTVALATDYNPGTAYCESMPMMIALAVSAMGMSLVQALTAATLGGAHALGLATEIGSIAPGKWCDLALLATHDERELAYHFGVNPVQRAVLRGRW